MEQRDTNHPRRIILWLIIVLLAVLVFVTILVRLIFPNRGPIATTGEY
jgi:hypothetical protein